MDTRTTQTTSPEEKDQSSSNKAKLRPIYMTIEDYEEDARMASETLRRGLEELEAVGKLEEFRARARALHRKK